MEKYYIICNCLALLLFLLLCYQSIQHLNSNPMGVRKEWGDIDLPIPGPVLSFCNHNPFRSNREELYNIYEYDRNTKDIMNKIHNIKNLKENYNYSTYRTFWFGRCIKTELKKVLNTTKLYSIPPIYFTEKLVGWVHQQGEEMSMVYSNQDPDSAQMVSFGVDEITYCQFHYYVWDQSTTQDCYEWKSEQEYFSCARKAVAKSKERKLEVENLLDIMFSNLTHSACKRRCISRGWRMRCSPAVENIVDEQIKFGFKGEIQLSYQEKEVEYIAYGPLNFIGEIGGYCGMLLGWSLVGCLMSTRGGLNYLRTMCHRRASIQSNKHAIVKVA